MVPPCEYCRRAIPTTMPSLVVVLLGFTLLGCEKHTDRAQPPAPPPPALAPPVDAVVMDAASPDAALRGPPSPCSKLALGETAECAVDATGNVSCVGDGAAKPVAIAGLANVDQLELGYAHGCARSATTAACWGYGELGQLGNGGKTSKTS